MVKNGVLAMANQQNKVRKVHFGRLGTLFQKLSTLLQKLSILLHGFCKPDRLLGTKKSKSAYFVEK
jgi:hypothetical protein